VEQVIATKEKKVTRLEAKLVDELLSDPRMSQTEAAIAAGYKKTTANVQASQVLKRPHVMAYKLAEMDKRAQRTDITKDLVLKNLMESMLMAKGELPVIETIWKDGEHQKVTRRKTNLVSLNRSLELMGKHLGMFDTKEQVDPNAPSLEKTMADISKENAQQRRTLLPKDNIDFDDV
jgi:phage terminase small subunit